MRRIRVIYFVLLLISYVAADRAAADETVVYQATTAGFRPHVLPHAAGQIDWTAGVIIAEGQGLATGVDAQAELMARRAAELDAARNALAIAAGVPVDARGAASTFANGRLLLEGCVKGHEIDEEHWLPTEVPPEYHVTLRVPLWGVKGVSAAFHAQHRRYRPPRQRGRLPFVVDSADVSDSVLVIDARGTGLQPCLFPTIVTDTGETLYDINAVSSEQAKVKPLARYVETEMTFDEIQAALDREVPIPGPASRPRVLLASFAPSDEPTPAPSPSPSPGATATPAPSPLLGPGPTATPTSEPTEVRSRRRKRSAVKAVTASGTTPTQIVLTRETADMLRKSAMGASLLRMSEVVIVVDSAAAGIQGRFEPLGEGTAIVLADAL
jgi:hypothetical protein